MTPKISTLRITSPDGDPSNVKVTLDDKPIDNIVSIHIVMKPNNMLSVAMTLVAGVEIDAAVVQRETLGFTSPKHLE